MRCFRDGIPARFRGLDGTVWGNVTDRRAVAYYPTSFDTARAHPKEPLWAGAAAHYLRVVRLEGDVAKATPAERFTFNALKDQHRLGPLAHLAARFRPLPVGE